MSVARLALQRHLWRLAVTAAVVWLVSCGMPGDAAPVVKVGLIAPFEGVGRPLGYQLLAVAREALTEANASAAFGRYRIALVALNDDLDPPTAARQAQALVQDHAVVAVIGPFDQATAAAAAPVLSAAGIPALIPAPLAQEFSGVRALCPSAGEIARVLEEAAAGPSADRSSPPIVHFPGDAESAADALVRYRAQGGRGEMLVGPDAVRPWFIQRAGPAAAGTRAVVCDLAGAPLAVEALPVVGLTRAGVAVLMQALSVAASGGELSRPAVAAALTSAVPGGVGLASGQAPASSAPIAPRLRWYRVTDGQWRAVSGK